MLSVSMIAVAWIGLLTGLNARADLRPAGVPAEVGEALAAVWRTAAAEESLKTWSVEEFSGLKSTGSREKHPADGKVSAWQGVLLSELAEAALKEVPVDRRAHFDLVILMAEDGSRALIPRAFIVKYPILLASRRDSKSLGSLYSVVPWSSKPKILAEGAPLESFFLEKVRRIEFGNYRDLFGGIFLKRRTDPSAMRGEKVFVQNCLSCHASGKGPSVAEVSGEQRSRKLASSGHPAVRGLPQLDERGRRSLMSYLEAFQAENPVPTQASVASPARP